MGKQTIIEKIREWLAGKCWKYFLKLSRITEEEYFKQIKPEKINLEERKKEFYETFAKTELGENQMILLTDEVSELWDWIDSVIRQSHQQGMDYQKGKDIIMVRNAGYSLSQIMEEE